MSKAAFFFTGSIIGFAIGTLTSTAIAYRRGKQKGFEEGLKDGMESGRILGKADAAIESLNAQLKAVAEEDKKLGDSINALETEILGLAKDLGMDSLGRRQKFRVIDGGDPDKKN